MKLDRKQCPKGLLEIKKKKVFSMSFIRKLISWSFTIQKHTWLLSLRVLEKSIERYSACTCKPQA